MPWRYIVLFLAVTFAWSWGFWSLPLLTHLGTALPAGLPDGVATGIPAAWGPFVGAVAVAVTRGGAAGLRTLFGRVLRLRIGWRMWLFVFLIFPVLIGASYLVAVATGQAGAPSEAMRQPVMIPVGFIFILLLGGPLQEEFGWRGTLLDPMQARFGAIVATVIVGSVWAVWHLPLFYFPNDIGPYYDRPFLGTLITLVLISFFFTWVWNRTGGSMAAMLVLHTMFNLAHWVLPVLEGDLAALTLFGLQALAAAIIILVFGLGTRGTPVRAVS